MVCDATVRSLSCRGKWYAMETAAAEGKRNSDMTPRKGYALGKYQDLRHP